MTQAIVASFSIESRWVPSCLETLIDKKVAGAALNFLQKLIDWFFSWFYCPYHSFYLEKAARVHAFNDGEVKLFDATKQGIGGINHNFITINGRKVLFNPNPHIETLFSRRTSTDYVVIRDDEKRRAGWFQIIEQEISRPGNPKPMEKLWLVNTNQFYPQLNGYLVEQPDVAI